MSDRETEDKDELEKADALRRALEADDGGGADAPEPDGLAELARSLRAAHEPKELSPREHEEILSRALPAARGQGRGQVIRVTFGVVSAMALAAAVLLYVRMAKVEGTGEPREPIAWVRSRSTTPLFAEPWKRGDATARIDRIALAREHDYRENRFAARRVR